MARILIYGTDENIAHKLSQTMQKEGYSTQICDAFTTLPAPIDEPTLVLLDARLKWAVCRPLFSQIQALSYPVLFMTADKEMTSHLRALYRGQSDVLMLPFSPRTAVGKVIAVCQQVGILKVGFLTQPPANN